MLVDFGRVQEALPPYRKAVEILPNAGLIRIALGHALLESGGGEESMQEAIVQLERAQQTEPRSARVHRLLATAYGRTGREDIAKLNLAEEALLQRRFDYARRQAEAAKDSFKEGSREWLKAQDIIAYLDNVTKEK